MYIEYNRIKDGKNGWIHIKDPIVHGCRVHPQEKFDVRHPDCKGRLIEKTSIYGAKMLACASSWEGKDGWK